jgi:hypothetical protein
LFEEQHRSSLPLELDFHVVASEAVNKMALFVEDPVLSLYQLSEDANHIVRSLGFWLLRFLSQCDSGDEYHAHCQK